MIVENDPRLIAGAVGAAVFYAIESDASEAALSDLRRALDDTCVEVFGNGPSPAKARIILTLTRFSDRIEMEFRGARRGGPEKLSSEQQQGIAGMPSIPGTPGVDRVQREVRDGVVVTRLTKYFSRPGQPA